MGIAVSFLITMHTTFVVASLPPDRMAGEDADSAAKCKCLPWDFAYDAGAVRCGQGQELFSWVQTSGLSWEQVLPFAQWDVCSEFFEKFRHDACVNVDAGAHAAEWHGAQWCYVPATCGDLNGGSRVPSSSVSWKVCHRRRDTMLQHFQPSELATLAAEQNLDLGFLAKAAYPLQAELWHQVEHLWWPSLAPNHILDSFGFPILPTPAVMHVEPVVYEVQTNSHESLVVAVGDSIWALSLNSEIFSQSARSFVCIVGCQEMSRFPASHDNASPAEAAALKTRDLASIDDTMVIVPTHGECMCLNWKQTYVSGRARCGQGLEFSTPMATLGLSQEQLPFVEQHKVCAEFFAVQDHQMCIHVDAGPAAHESDAESWCYVPASCDGLVNSGSVRLKMCTASEVAISWNYASSVTASPLESDSDIRGFRVVSVSDKLSEELDGPPAGLRLVSGSDKLSEGLAGPTARLRGSRLALGVAAEAAHSSQSNGPADGVVGQLPTMDEPRRWASLRSGFSPGTALGRLVVWMISSLPWIVGIYVLVVKASQVARWMWSQILDDLSSASPAVFVLEVQELCWRCKARCTQVSAHVATGSVSLVVLGREMKEGLITRLHTVWPAFFCQPWCSEPSQQSARSSIKTARVDWDRIVRLHTDTSSTRR